MGAILGFFLNPTSVFAPIAAAIASAVVAFGLGLGLGYVKGWDGAVLEYSVASLKDEVERYKKAAEDAAKQLDEDRELAEAQEGKRAALEAEIEKVLHAAPSNRPDACRLSGDQLLKLRSYIAKSG